MSNDISTPKSILQCTRIETHANILPIRIGFGYRTSYAAYIRFSINRISARTTKVAAKTYVHAVIYILVTVGVDRAQSLKQIGIAQGRKCCIPSIG